MIERGLEVNDSYSAHVGRKVDRRRFVETSAFVKNGTMWNNIVIVDKIGYINI